jgi:tryptophan halogenase
MKIVIVGGGTAGWLAALMIKKIHVELHDVTLIESSAIGIIGAGESSTGLLRGIINNETWDFGCNEIDFLKYCKATPKLAIMHKNWKGNGSEYVAPLDSALDDTPVGTNCLLLSYIANDIPMQNSSIGGRLFEGGRVPFYIDDAGQLKSVNRHSYNFDARLAAKYLENICGTSIKKIDAKILDVELKENGFVKTLNLDNGQVITGDFFIDASGFSRVFTKKLGVKWIDYKELTLNAAMPFFTDYDENYELKYAASAHALKNGWMWSIPKGNDVGNGYAYDSNFVSDEEAQREVETLLGKKINPVKFIKYQTGRLENVWNKNVLSIGLSASFLEPLEATSIHSTIIQLNTFVFDCLKETLDRTMSTSVQTSYNNNITKLFEDFKTFIILHYKNNRTDSDFWINANNVIKNNDRLNHIIDISKVRLLNKSDVDDIYGYVSAELYNYILCGLGHFSKDTAIKEYALLKRKETAISKEIELTNWLSQHNWLTNKEIFKILHQRDI